MRKRKVLTLTIVSFILVLFLSMPIYASSPAADPDCGDWVEWNVYEDCINGKWTQVTQWVQICIHDNGRVEIKEKNTYKTLLNVCPLLTSN